MGLGYQKRFGIVHVNYQNQRRSVKESGLDYARIIKERALRPLLG